MQMAIGLAEEHSADGTCGPFGAVVVSGEQVVGRGWNMVRGDRDPSAHAEIVAIREACRNLHTHTLSGCTIYASCEPCPMCLGAIYWARLDRMVYACDRTDAARAGFDDQTMYDEFRREPCQRRIPTSQVCRTKGLAVLEGWRANPSRQEY